MPDTEGVEPKTMIIGANNVFEVGCGILCRQTGRFQAVADTFQFFSAEKTQQKHERCHVFPPEGAVGCPLRSAPHGTFTVCYIFCVFVLNINSEVQILNESPAVCQALKIGDSNVIESKGESSIGSV